MDPMRTPTKKRPLETINDSPLKSNSPKFMKPSELFKRRIGRKPQTSTSFSPSKVNAAIRRCKLPIECVEKLYSPLKCLQQKKAIANPVQSPSSSQPISEFKSSKDGSSTTGARKITFSPLMKKLQRSPMRNQLSFPVVARNSNHHNALKHRLESRISETASRVLDFSENAQELPSLKQATSAEAQPKLSLEQPNIDWTLKNRLRIVINRSIPFHGTLAATDEASGMNDFVRGGTIGSPESTFAAELHRHCLVWQQPYLPGMKLFPRQPELKPGTKLSSRVPPVFTISPTGALADSIHADFCQSLNSLFKLLKTKYCPYFYLCANNFVVVFRASGVAANQEAHALITPTTLGFRRLMEKEGISYQTPFYGSNQKPRQHRPTSNDENSESSGIEPDLEDEDDDEEDDDDDEESVRINDDDNDDQESNQWLESMGLSQQDFPSLETSAWRRRRQRMSSANSVSKQKILDDQSAKGKLKSLCRVSGLSHLQTLINLFINYRKVCVSTSGPFAGITPTLLSPIAFHGATLIPIQLRQKTTENSSRPSNRPTPSTMTTVDLSGPILPHTVFGLMSLLGKLCSNTADGDGQNTVVRSTLRIYDSSSSFALEAGIQKNIHEESSTYNPTFAVENLQESGMDRKFLMAICSGDRHLTTPMNDFELSTTNGIRYNRFDWTNRSTKTPNSKQKTIVSVFGTASSKR